MAVKRIDGKPGKWIDVDKGLPSNNFPVLICVEFPNRERILALAKLIRDYWQITALAENNAFLSVNGKPADLNDDSVQEELNRFVRCWQRIELP